MRFLPFVAALAVTAIGLLCLNYTVDGKAVHHREWALEHGAPEPSDDIFVLGLIATTAGAGATGFLVGRRRRP